MKKRRRIRICLTLIVLIMLTASFCACVHEQVSDDVGTSYVTLMDGDEVFRESYDASKVLRFTPTTKT